jgi:hypothetical protein
LEAAKVYSQLNIEPAAVSPDGLKPIFGGRGNGAERSLTVPLDKWSFSAFGVNFAISSDAGDMLRDSLGYLPPGCTRTSSVGAHIEYSVTHHSGAGANGISSLARNGRNLFRCEDRTEFLERLGSIIALDVADNSREFVFVHAGVVGWGKRAIVIPGRSFSGKTTLVAELVRAGAKYYSDEFAVIDGYGRVFPYPQPLQLRDPRTYRQTRCPVERLGGAAGDVPLPIELILFSKYKEDANWLPQRLSPGIGCLQMLNNTISARSAPAIALRILNQAVSKAAMVKGLRGDISTVIQWITTNFGPLENR